MRGWGEEKRKITKITTKKRWAICEKFSAGKYEFLWEIQANYVYSVGVVQCLAILLNFTSPVFFSVNITWRGWEFHLVKSEKVSNIIQKKSKYSFLNKRQKQRRGGKNNNFLCVSQMMFRLSKRRSLINLYLSNAICLNTFSDKFFFAVISGDVSKGTMIAQLVQTNL
jgi:hydroxymethylpyrimidine pyrophosphatase-like HAD family hydrolase